MTKEREKIGRLEILEHMGKDSYCAGMIGIVNKIVDTNTKELNYEIICKDCEQESVVPVSYEKFKEIKNSR